MKRVTQIIRLLACISLILVIAINKNNKVLGFNLAESDTKNELKDEWIASDGQRVISTQRIGETILGYNGNVPLLVYICDGKISRIEILPNEETPKFIESVVRSGLLEKWNGLTPDEALETDVDAVSGATFTSSAIIQSVKAAMSYAIQTPAVKKDKFNWLDIKFWSVIIVVLCGMTIPLFTKNKTVRMIQLILNVIVLGIWSGTFISLTLLVSFFSNGIHSWAMLSFLLIMVAGFIYPLFGKKSYYCTHLCPLGSCQELIGRAIPYKLRLSPKAVKVLTKLKELLWFVIMGIMCLGVGFEIMDYELFTVFLFGSASTYIIVAGVVFALLSGIINRPYCRFVCPTGTLLTFPEKNARLKNGK